ncbi:MAG: alkyl hydroperoxide reductase [Armatimonadetes bacterium]|nr:alkyl hydroperoxide reductase [Armatimonadota bacterium]
MEKLNRFRPWFYAAAAYNLLWGACAVLFPNAMFRMLGMPLPNYPSFFQAIGMMVGVYAIGYWLIARNPLRYGPFVYIGLLGKLCGPIGLAFAAMQGELPWRFGWINLTNDIIWLPAFIAFALQVWRVDRESAGPTG